MLIVLVTTRINQIYIKFAIQTIKWAKKLCMHNKKG